ncbi:MAG: histidine phosphatase family protein [Chloroflexia bacterium]
MSQLRLLLVRHGQSAANAEHRMQGRLDSPLTALGRRQADAMAARITREPHLDALYSSPLQRALHTADALAACWTLRPIVLDDLMETDIGEATGLTWQEFNARWPQEGVAIRSGEPDAIWPGGESRAQLAARAARVMDYVTGRHPSGVVAVVSHGGTLRWAVAHLMRGKEFGHSDHGFDNCAVTEVILGDGEPSIACANDTDHLADVEEEEVRSA